MPMNKTYRIKVKNGRNLIEIEGDKEFVNRAFDEIKDIFSEGQTKRIPKKRGPKPKPKPEIDLKSLETPDILNKLDGKDKTLTILVSGYCINKKLKKREFRSKEMTDFLKGNKLSVPDNLTYFFRKLKDEGLFIQGRKQGRFKVSDDGIKAIEKKLG